MYKPCVGVHNHACMYAFIHVAPRSYYNNYSSKFNSISAFCKHFETDDPSIWCRVEHVRDDNVEDLELSLKFADEIIENGHSTSDPLVRKRCMFYKVH